MNSIINRYTVFALLWGCFVVVMALAARVDYQWTMLLHSHENKVYTDIMGRTLFEGDALSPNDLVIFLFAGLVLIYIRSITAGAGSKFLPWRPGLGFVAAGGLITGLGMVHSLKWVMGRARPGDLLRHDLPYSEWFEFGAHFLAETSHRGSFPSGHTAQAFMLMSVAYLLAGDPRHSRALKTAGLALGALVLVFALAMGVSRSMSLHHWVSDWLGSIFLSWIIIHTLYYWVIQVPEQARLLASGRMLPGQGRFRELILCLMVFLLLAGAMAVLTGIRSLLVPGSWGLALLIPMGLAGIAISWKLLRMFRLKPGHSRAGS